MWGSESEPDQLGRAVAITVNASGTPAPVASPVPDCVDGPGRAAAKACPATAPHVCYAGPAKGGCARAPWSRTDCARSCKRPKGFD